MKSCYQVNPNNHYTPLYLSKPNPMKKTFSTILLEMIPVILGVLIAFFINDWKDKADEKKYLDRVFKGVVNELHANKEDLEGILEYRETQLDTFYHYAADENVALIDLIFKFNGFKGVVLKHTSWQALKSSRLELLDYEYIPILAGIEEGAEAMDNKASKMMDYIYEHAESKSTAKKQLFAAMVEDVAILEEGLLEFHQAFFKIYGKGTKAESEEFSLN